MRTPYLSSEHSADAWTGLQEALVWALHLQEPQASTYERDRLVEALRRALSLAMDIPWE